MEQLMRGWNVGGTSALGNGFPVCVCRYVLKLCMLETREEAAHYELGVRIDSTNPKSYLLLCNHI